MSGAAHGTPIGAPDPAPRRDRTGTGAYARDVGWAIGGVAAAAGVYANRGDPDTIRTVQLLWGAFAPLLCGLLLLFVAPAWARPRRYRVLLGIGLILSNLVGSAAGDVKLFVVGAWGNLVNLAGLLFVLAGVLERIMRKQHLTSLRASMESLMVGSCVAVIAWQVIFIRLIDPAQTMPVMVELLINGYIFGLTALAWGRGGDRGLAIASAGATLLIATHLYLVYLDMSGQIRTWPPAALGCLAWPLVVIGLLRCGPVAKYSSRSREADVEGRSLVFLSTVTVIAISGLVYVTVAVPYRMDGPTWVCCGIFLVASWARELIRAWQSHRMMSQLETAATKDSLTGLGNLRGLDEAIATLAATNLDRPGTSGRTLTRRQMSAMTVDVNRFKDVNDLLGRATADELLRTLAALLVERTRHMDAQTFRPAGNEFLVLSQGRAEHLELVATELRDSLRLAASSIPGLARIPLSAAVGIAHLPVRADVTEHVLRLLTTQSTQAMRQAKESQRAVAVFDDSLAAAQRRNWQIEAVLRERLAATEGKGVDVHFQPIISLNDGRLASVEALARWCDPRLADVTPAEFIAVAERTGLIERLGLQIMRDALIGARKSGLLAAGKKVAVNVSALQLRAPRFVAEVCDLLASQGVGAGQLVIEVTESVFVSTDDPAVKSLNDLHHQGIAVVLDDFGTGFSSLSYLTRLPVEGLKIDRSITLDLDNTKTHAIASSIAQMAKRLDLDVVVEGVEDARQEEHVLGLGLNRVQGWRYSKAVDVEGLSALINLTHLPSQLAGNRRQRNITRLA